MSSSTTGAGPATPPPRPPREPGSVRARSVTQRMGSILAAVSAKERTSNGTLRRRALLPVLLMRVVLQVVRQWARDRCPQQAASLAFQTVLSLVPLTALGLAVLRSAGAFEVESTLVTYLSRQVIPVSREEIASYLLTWAGNLSFRTAGLAGLLTTVMLSFVLFASVDRIFNDIWRSERRRSLAHKFTVFYTLVTIVPAAMGFSLFHAARFGLTAGLPSALFSLTSTWLALLCANKLLPTGRVALRAAALGALVSAIAFEVAKHLFNYYVTRVAFQGYAGVYGTLALVPIVLIWVYYAWLVILLGAEISHTFQNLHHLEMLDSRGRLPAEREIVDKVNGATAARLMCAVVRNYRNGDGPLAKAVLASRFDLDEGVVERVFSRLREHGLVMEVDGEATGYLPSRLPVDITLLDVLLPFRGTEASAPLVSGERARLELALADIEQLTDSRARTVTLDELTKL
ncbi:MAG: YihY family inner membrane protein [Pseudomonadota bacterium]